MRSCDGCGKKLTFWNSGSGPICSTCIRMEGMTSPAPGPRAILGKPLRCAHCGGDQFATQDVMLNTRGLTLLNLDFLNKSADAHICTSCGRIEWFVRHKTAPLPPATVR